MANEFVIKKGLSEKLFQLTPDQLIENGWYLTIDTAEVYVALKQSSGLLELKKINECNIEHDLDLDSFESRLDVLEADEKIHTYGYRNAFPIVGQEGHIYVAIDEQKTYAFYDNNYITVGELSTEADSFDIIFGGTADN